MPGTPKPYALLSCHVERILDDRVWHAYLELVRRRPGGFVVASLVRPADAARGESERVWLERARRLAAEGPFGHHTHWTSPDHARPGDGEDTAARVLREGAWLRGHGLEPTVFCGGGWYTDASVAGACALLGYVDCTPRMARPAYLPEGAPWAQLGVPARVETAHGDVLAIPTTRSLGDLVRAAARPSRLPEPVVHGYLHDTDLLDARRRRALAVALTVLGRRYAVCEIDGCAARVAGSAVRVPWQAVARGRASGGEE